VASGEGKKQGWKYNQQEEVCGGKEEDPRLGVPRKVDQKTTLDKSSKKEDGVVGTIATRQRGKAPQNERKIIEQKQVSPPTEERRGSRKNQNNGGN